MTENQIKTKLMAWLKTIPKCKSFRVEQRPGMGRGVSDILICYRGIFMAVEVKLQGKKPTALQRKFLDDVVKAGGRAIVITCHDHKYAIHSLEIEFSDINYILAGGFYGDA